MRSFLFLVAYLSALVKHLSTGKLYHQEKSESWIIGVDEGVDGAKSGNDRTVSY